MLINLLIWLPIIALPFLLWTKKHHLLAGITVFLQFICLSFASFSWTFEKNLYQKPAFWFEQKLHWIEISLGKSGILQINYWIGVDSQNILMLWLSLIVFMIAVVSSARNKQVNAGYWALFFVLNTCTLGSFLALDSFLFYLFFEFMLLPMFFLIGIWGGQRKEYAAIKFFLYTLFGSVFLLVIMAIWAYTVIDPVETALKLGLTSDIQSVSPQMISNIQQDLLQGKLNLENSVHSVGFLPISDLRNYLPNSLLSESGLLWGISGRWIAFWILFFAFAVKLPAIPFHTWLPDAHVEAPTAISVILAGILLKVGGYGLMRITFGFFPDIANQQLNLIAAFGSIAIVYGALVAMAQTDLKKLIAYSSVSHMGYILLGLASYQSTGWLGVQYQLFAHGLISSMLFLLVGVLYERTHNREIAAYQGLWTKLPWFSAMVLVGFFAGMGLPGFCGFVAEWLVYTGATQAFIAGKIHISWIIIAVLGVVFSAAYFLYTFRRMFMGEFKLQDSNWSLVDLDTSEKILLILLSILILLTGIFPNVLIGTISSGIAEWLR